MPRFRLGAILFRTFLRYAATESERKFKFKAISVGLVGLQAVRKASILFALIVVTLFVWAASIMAIYYDCLLQLKNGDTFRVDTIISGMLVLFLAASLVIYNIFSERRWLMAFGWARVETMIREHPHAREKQKVAPDLRETVNRLVEERITQLRPTLKAVPDPLIKGDSGTAHAEGQ